MDPNVSNSIAATVTHNTVQWGNLVDRLDNTGHESMDDCSAMLNVFFMNNSPQQPPIVTLAHSTSQDLLETINWKIVTTAFHEYLTTAAQGSILAHPTSHYNLLEDCHQVLTYINITLLIINTFKFTAPCHLIINPNTRKPQHIWNNM